MRARTRKLVAAIIVKMCHDRTRRTSRCAPLDDGVENRLAHRVGDWLITLRISLVAVCCSRCGQARRVRSLLCIEEHVTFSIAITAWSRTS